METSGRGHTRTRYAQTPVVTAPYRSSEDGSVGRM